MRIIENVSVWLSYAGGALIKVADSAGSTVSVISYNNICSTYFSKDSHHSLGDS